MLKIQKSANEKSVVLTLSGRIKAERLAELEKLWNAKRVIILYFWI